MEDRHRRRDTGTGPGQTPGGKDLHQSDQQRDQIHAGKGTITVRVRRDPHAATIEVSDTGIGVSKEDLNKLFDEFYRVDNVINQNVKGTGLGLSLVKKIVDAHKGRVWVTSEVNHGTTFHFTLPLIPQRR